MIHLFILALSLLHHHKPTTKPVDPGIAAQATAQHDMDMQADEYELKSYIILRRLREECPFVPTEYFSAVVNDLNKVAPEHVGDPTFREDFDQLDADMTSLIFISEQLGLMEKT